MHFYSKQAPFGSSPTDFYQGDVLKFFNFLYFAHSDHHATYKDLLNDSKRRHAFFDLAASFTAQLQYRGMLDVKRFAEHALRYFQLALQARDYKVITTDELSLISDQFQDTVLLITGCQTPEVRNARVEGGYKALKHLNTPLVRVVLSGAHPAIDSANRVRSEQFPIEPDEAGTMKVRFTELLEEDQNPPKCRVELYKESSSTRTSENINHFFETMKFNSQTKSHMLVSSSAFHLPRIADELEKFLGEGDRNVYQVTLIPAEHHSLGESADTIRHQIYVKQMTYELVRMVFTQKADRIDELFRRETSLRV